MFVQFEGQQRHQWTKEENLALEQFFSKEMNDVSESGNKGKLISEIITLLHFLNYLSSKYMLKIIG